MENVEHSFLFVVIEDIIQQGPNKLTKNRIVYLTIGCIGYIYLINLYTRIIAKFHKIDA